MSSETTVSPSAPMPKGYGFLPKGIQYKTLHCRKLTREARKPLYLVVANKKHIGIRVPKSILRQVHAQAEQTFSTRRAATKKRDAADIAAAAAELKTHFPKIPKAERESVLKHSFKKHSGRVGRTGTLSISQKVIRAVVAHVRHKHTTYDRLMNEGEEKSVARKSTWLQVEKTMRKWGFKGDLSGHIRKRRQSTPGYSDMDS